ncbi:hypothetical protein [Rhizohabitans arisaemae]|uniref:hypothetical protein n=1 Tax=Rhizohabitans arisaemae TaxID=2720610 RepID=UPI0024B0E209|nr:hypothetical protein [Rhizohabitans arisaemae]
MSVDVRYHVILVVDIHGFDGRGNPTQAWLRKELHRLIDDALDAARIDRAGAPPPSDRGDGIVRILPGSTPKVELTGGFVDRLHAGLRNHARITSAEGALRLRIALHGGEVGRDGSGWVGEDLGYACRLADLPALRGALDAADRSGLALVVSDDWYGRVVRQGYAEVDRSEYEAVSLPEDEFDEVAWIRVPGYGSPPGIGRWRAAARTRCEEPPRDTAPGRPPPSHSGSGGPVYSGPFAGSQVNAENVYGGHHFTDGVWRGGDGSVWRSGRDRGAESDER